MYLSESSDEDPRVGSISQPPFFRTREVGKPLYKSCCYKIPEQPSLVEVLNEANGEESILDYRKLKDPSKTIQFVGVDAMEYDESWPTTQYTSLSPEVPISLIIYSLGMQLYLQ